MVVVHLKDVDYNICYKLINYKIMLYLDQFLSLSFILFILGLWGIFLNRKNLILMLMSIELMLLAININLLFFLFF